MKTTGETGRVAYKFRLFGWHITISNAPVKFKPGVAPGRTANYDRIMHKRHGAPVEIDNGQKEEEK